MAPNTAQLLVSYLSLKEIWCLINLLLVIVPGVSALGDIMAAVTSISGTMLFPTGMLALGDSGTIINRKAPAPMGQALPVLMAGGPTVAYALSS